MGYFSNKHIEMQEDNIEIDESPSQDDIEQQAQKPMPSEEAIWRFLDWLDSKSTKENRNDWFIKHLYNFSFNNSSNPDWINSIFRYMGS